MKRIRTWAIPDDFWALVEPLLPASHREPTKPYRRKPGGGRKPTYSDRLYFRVSCMSCARASNRLPPNAIENHRMPSYHCIMDILLSVSDRTLDPLPIAIALSGQSVPMTS